MFTFASKVWAVQNLEIIKTCIENARTVLISGHKNPDGDSLGALLSLGLGLESIGKEVIMLCEDEIPQRYWHLPGIQKVVRSVNSQVDLAVAVDCGSKEMIGRAFSAFEHADHILEIDHHSSRTSFGDFSFVDSAASSAGEMVYFLLEELGIVITSDIAQNILTSIIVETNSFRLPGLRSQTFELCAELLRTGLDFSRVAESVYWVNNRETELLGGICLSRCRFALGGQLAYSFLSLKDLQRVNGAEADADPVIEKLRSMAGVQLAVLFREKNNGFLRVSFRSKNNINVADLAEQFGGGGHSSAAGCTIPNDKYHREMVIKAAKDILMCELSRQNSQNIDQITTTAEFPIVCFNNALGGKDVRLPPWKKNGGLPSSGVFSKTIQVRKVAS